MPIGSFTEFTLQLKSFLNNDEIIDSYSQRYAFGTDASFYRLVPKLVLRLKNKYQIKHVLTLAHTLKVPVTFRAAGTSLSGQAITDSVLITLTNDWQEYEISQNGEKIKVQPGLIGAKVNRILAPYSRKIGPDPASIDSCKIGGIAANNSSGMCCGVKQNSYHTVADMTIIFANGTELNTANKDSCQRFLSEQSKMIDHLNSLLVTVQKNKQLSELIRHKYRLKNTCGYGINSLLDFTDPIDVIKHLLIGSEGTLGFIADITYHTVEVHEHKLTGFYVFEHLNKACDIVSQLAKLDVTAVELLDYRALKSVAHHSLMTPCIANLKNTSAALLIELQASDEAQLSALKQQVLLPLNKQQHELISYQVDFTTDYKVSNELWQIRKATFPAVGAVRENGTTVIIEDVAFPIEQLATGVRELQALFEKYDYHEAIIFGHALDGNLHFVFTQAFDTEKEKQRYSAFMDDVAHLVAVRFKGSLKAEHGTGRNMAPFVEFEWGTEAYQLMTKLKQTFDPKGILNPGVIINEDRQAHLQNLKSLPAADSIIDKCIECGFCESVCPSTNFSFTPRQRITVWRRIKALAQLLDSAPASHNETSALQKEYDELLKDYQTSGIDSCAATGLCGLKCPVGINTGEFIKSLRAKAFNNKPLSQKTSCYIANNLDSTLSLTRFGLSSVAQAKSLLSSPIIQGGFKALHTLTGKRIPLYYPAWPKGEKKVQKLQPVETQTQLTKNNKQVVYIPTCGTRTFAQDSQAIDKRPLAEVVQAILIKAGYQVIIPNNINNLCCGMPFSSKGDNASAEKKTLELLNSVEHLTNNSKIPVILDASSCAFHMIDSKHNIDKNIYELSDFIAQYVLNELNITPQQEAISLHVTCSTIRNKADNQLVKIAKACAEKVIIPNDINCCGFAGDKGFVLPELNENALKPLKVQVSNKVNQGFSNNRTCEIGLTKATDIPYQSIVYLLDKVSSGKLK